MKEKYKKVLDFDISKFTNPLLEYSVKWVKELHEELNKQPMNVKKFVDIVYNSAVIFPYGTGRSGAACDYGGIRLNQAGYNVYHRNDPFKPPIKEDDTFFCVSASGETLSVVDAARIAKKNNAKVLALTTSKMSELANLSSAKIILDGDTKYNSTKKQKEPIEYLGTRTEYKFISFMDILANEIIKRKGMSENDLRKNHGNIE